MLQFRPFSVKSWASGLHPLGSLGFALILMTMSGFIFEQRDASAVLSGQINIYNAARLIISITVFIICAVNLYKIPIKINLSIFLFIVYCIFCIASSIWSNSAVVTAGKASEIFLSTILVILIASKGGSELIDRALFVVLYTMFFLVSFIIVMFLFGFDGFSEPGAGFLSDMVGRRATAPFLSANSVGYFSAILVCFILSSMLGNLLRHNFRNYITLSILFAFIILSGSRTSLILVLLIFPTVFLSINRKYILLSIFIVTSTLLLAYSDRISNLLQGNMPDSVFWSLTGRISMWTWALDAFSASPIFGHGYGVGARTIFFDNNRGEFVDTISSIHNAFLEVLINVGILGFIPWLLSIFVCALNLFRVQIDRNFVTASGPYIIALMMGIMFMSTSLGGRVSPIIIIFLLLAAGARPAHRRASSIANSHPSQHLPAARR